MKLIIRKSGNDVSMSEEDFNMLMMWLQSVGVDISATQLEKKKNTRNYFFAAVALVCSVLGLVIGIYLS